MIKSMKDYTFEIGNMLEHLFGRREVKMLYIYMNGKFTIYVDGKELETDTWLDDIIKKYDYMQRMETKLFKKNKSYEDMIKIIEDEQLEVYIFPEQYEWTRN